MPLIFCYLKTIKKVFNGWAKKRDAQQASLFKLVQELSYFLGIRML